MKNCINVKFCGQSAADHLLLIEIITLSKELANIYKQTGCKCRLREDAQYKPRFLFSPAGVYLQETKRDKNFNLDKDRLYYVKPWNRLKSFNENQGINYQLDKLPVMRKILDSIESNNEQATIHIGDNDLIHVTGYDSLNVEFHYKFNTLRSTPDMGIYNFKQFYEYKQMRLH